MRTASAASEFFPREIITLVHVAHVVSTVQEDTLRSP
jgi:hypothetical protein